MSIYRYVYSQAVKFTKPMSLPEQDLEFEGAKDQLIDECEVIWKHVEEVISDLLEMVSATAAR